MGKNKKADKQVGKLVVAIKQISVKPYLLFLGVKISPIQTVLPSRGILLYPLRQYAGAYDSGGMRNTWPT